MTKDNDDITCTACGDNYKSFKLGEMPHRDDFCRDCNKNLHPGYEGTGLMESSDPKHYLRKYVYDRST